MYAFDPNIATGQGSQNGDQNFLLAFDRTGLIVFFNQSITRNGTGAQDDQSYTFTFQSMSQPTASWGDWVKLDNGYATEGLAVASWAANRRDLFTISSDHALWHKSWDGNSWSGWDWLGGSFMGQPAAVSWDQNRLDIFAVGTDQRLWHRYFDKGWGTWETFGGVLKLGVAAASWGPGQLTVYSVGVDNSIYSKSFGANGWSGFQKLNSFCTSPPAATAYAENELTLGCIGGGNNLYSINYNSSGYQGWVDAGGIGLDVATSSWGPDQFAFFVRGPDFKVYLKTYDNGSSNDWIGLDGVAAYPLAAIAPAPDWMEVYAIGPDHGVYQRVYK